MISNDEEAEKWQETVRNLPSWNDNLAQAWSKTVKSLPTLDDMRIPNGLSSLNDWQARIQGERAGKSKDQTLLETLEQQGSASAAVTSAGR